jgi:hypothetical protein
LTMAQYIYRYTHRQSVGILRKSDGNLVRLAAPGAESSLFEKRTIQGNC